MLCADCRELISARLDGEDDPANTPALEEHLAGCPGCARFAGRAAEVTRLSRTGLAEPGPDLVAAVLGDGAARRPIVRRRRLVSGLRWGLGLVGLGQIALAVAGVAGAAFAGHGGMELNGASAAHMAHETAAWNLAIGIGFGAVALGGTRRRGGVLPVVGAFVGVLTVLSALDLAAGRVDLARLGGHAMVVLGYLLLLLHGRLLRGDGDGGALAGGLVRSSVGRRGASGTGPALSPAFPAGPAAGAGSVARADHEAA